LIWAIRENDLKAHGYDATPSLHPMLRRKTSGAYAHDVGGLHGSMSTGGFPATANLSRDQLMRWKLIPSSIAYVTVAVAKAAP
jgi:hypothetical protein